jgi:hypothetical protein
MANTAENKKRRDLFASLPVIPGTKLYRKFGPKSGDNFSEWQSQCHPENL